MTERDRGVTLIEVVVALSLMGFALVSLLGGLWSTVRVSVAAADHSQADAAMQTAVAELEALPYVACATPTTYNLGLNATVTAILYWQAGTWSSSCAGSIAQRVTVAVASAPTIDVVKTDD